MDEDEEHGENRTGIHGEKGSARGRGRGTFDDGGDLSYDPATGVGIGDIYS